MRCTDRLRGLTLLEMAISLAVTGLIVLGLGSTMVVASKAMPTGPAHSTLLGTHAIEQLSAELAYATAINSRSARSVEFTVADRNSDAVPETIRYEWSGAAGSPLTRRYNGGTAVSLLDAVQTFGLTYHLDTTSTQTAQSTEGAESLLRSFQAVDVSHDYVITSGGWYGQYFKPILPADTVSWKVTRVEFYAKASGYYGGSSRIQLQSATAGHVPSGVVLEETIMDEYYLWDFYLKQSFSFDVSGLSPDQGLCLVFRHEEGQESCRIQGDESIGSAASDSSLVLSTDRGASWSTYSSESLRYAAYGTVTSPGQPQTQQVLYLSGVDVSVQTGTDTTARSVAGVRLLNRPEVLP